MDDAGIYELLWYFEEGFMYFEVGGEVLCRGWCGTLKRVMWYFEEGGVLLCRGWCGNLNA